MNKLDDRVFTYIEKQPDPNSRMAETGLACTYEDGCIATLCYLMPVITHLLNCTLALESKDEIRRLRTLDDLRLFLIETEEGKKKRKK